MHGGLGITTNYLCSLQVAAVLSFPLKAALMGLLRSSNHVFILPPHSKSLRQVKLQFYSEHGHLTEFERPCSTRHKRR